MDVSNAEWDYVKPRPNGEIRWLLHNSDWTIGQWDNVTFGEAGAHWSIIGSDELFCDKNFEEIGPIISFE